MRSALFLFLLAATACSAPATDTAAPANATATAAVVSGTTAPKVVHGVTAAHLFSDAKQPDTFRLQLLGDDVLTAKAHFSIVSAAGDTLWSEHFPASSLLSYDTPEPSADVRRADVVKRVDDFFQARKYMAVAIKPESKFDADNNGTKEVWAEAKQRHAPGFSYLLGDEDGRTLAYSPKLGKVHIVFNCC